MSLHDDTFNHLAFGRVIESDELFTVLLLAVSSISNRFARALAHVTLTIRLTFLLLAVFWTRMLNYTVVESDDLFPFFLSPCSGHVS